MREKMLRVRFDEADENGIVGHRPKFSESLEEFPDMNPYADTRGQLPDQQQAWRPMGRSYFAPGQNEAVVKLGGCAQPGMELIFRLYPALPECPTWEILPETPGQPGSGVFCLRLSEPAAQRVEFAWAILPPA